MHYGVKFGLLGAVVGAFIVLSPSCTGEEAARIEQGLNAMQAQLAQQEQLWQERLDLAIQNQNEEMEKTAEETLSLIRDEFSPPVNEAKEVLAESQGPDGELNPTPLLNTLGGLLPPPFNVILPTAGALLWGVWEKRRTLKNVAVSFSEAKKADPNFANAFSSAPVKHALWNNLSDSNAALIERYRTA